MRLTSSRIVGAAAFALLTACRADVPTEPIGRPATPSDPKLVLTGAVGTPIFPSVTPGEAQPSGDARGLNRLGHVTGAEHGLVLIDDTFKPYRWTRESGAVKLIGCCDAEWGNDINDAGTVVGVAQTSVLVGNRGFVATATSMTTLPILPGADPEASSGAIAINNAGQIVGISPVSGGALHAVLWSPSLVPQDLGTLGGLVSATIDINDAGQVIGYSFLAGDATLHFFLWSAAGGMVDLNIVINPRLSSVDEINTSGQIIGSYFTSTGLLHAFLYTPGSGLRDLGTLGGPESTPTGLNDRGDVVGSSTLADGSTHAFLWTAADGMEDITALTGVPEVRRLNDNLQTLTGTDAPATFPNVTLTSPRLVQLQVTQSNAPPTALFTSQCNGLTCVLDASGSLDDKPGLTFAWDLGKYPGGSATGPVVTVTYPHAGQRTITLTVTDANGLTSTLTRTITITDLPIAAFTMSCTDLTCTFDSSGSTNGDNPIGRRIWSFGDGQSALDVVATSHTYAQPGTYDVTLEVWGSSIAQRAILTQRVTVGSPPSDQAPVASFTFSCVDHAHPHQCQFDASTSTDDVGIVSYTWDWGNGRHETKKRPLVRNTWPKGGNYLVTLTVTDTKGQTNSTARTVSVP